MICPAICCFECFAWNLQRLRFPQGLRKINSKTSFWTSSLFNYWAASPSNWQDLCNSDISSWGFHIETWLIDFTKFLSTAGHKKQVFCHLAMGELRPLPGRFNSRRWWNFRHTLASFGLTKRGLSPGGTETKPLFDDDRFSNSFANLGNYEGLND